MKAIQLPDVAYLKECYTYCPVTGFLFWNVRPLHHFANSSTQAKWNNQYAGTRAFTSKDGEGYYYGGITYQGSRRFYKAHRVIWKLLYNTEPVQIDHDNRDRTDNRKSNLVIATAETNAKNRKKRSDNSTGYTGVSIASSGKFVARLANKYLGTFDTALDAHNAREAVKHTHGYHTNHGL